MDDARSIFSGIHRANAWGDRQSASGPGSNLRQTEILSRELPAALARLGVKSLADAPCGDMNWMRRISYDFTRYHGIDIAPEVVAGLKSQIWSDIYTFSCGDITSDPLPKVDAILCRDALVHLPYRMIHAFIGNLKSSEIPYLLTTTFPEHGPNQDILSGEWRPLNLALAPFHFPAPLALLNEEYHDGGGAFADKSLALWNLADIVKAPEKS